MYSGDCLENNPHKINAAIADGEVLVTRRGTAEVNVPISKTSLLAREGTLKSPSSPVSGLEVKLTNTACAASPTPNNASKLVITRVQKTTGAGTLESPYQPFGAYELCVASSAKKKRYKYSSSNTTEAGTSPSIYLGAKSSTEKAELKTKKEGEEKADQRKTRKRSQRSQRKTRKRRSHGQSQTHHGRKTGQRKMGNRRKNQSEY